MNEDLAMSDESVTLKSGDTIPEPVNCSSQSDSTWTIWDRIRCRLFPAKHCFTPDAPAEFKDCLTCHTITHLSLIDRVRALITGVVVVSTRTVTENEIGNSVTASTCHIGTWRDLKGW